MRGVSAVPAVAGDDHDRSMAEHAPRPLPVEGAERVADARATAEVVHALAHRFERPVEVTLAQQARDAGQPRREDESLDALAARDGGGEDQEEPRVAFHRAAHIADEHQRPPPDARLAPEESHQLAARANRVTGRSPEVDASGGSGSKPARAPLRHPPWRLLQESLDLFRLRPRHLLEVLVAQQLFCAVTAGARGEFLVLALTVHLRGVQAERVGPGLRPLG